MNLDGVLFLATETARSKAYAQAFQAHGFRIQQTVVFDTPGNRRLGNVTNLAVPEDDCVVALPDLSVPLLNTCAAISDKVERISADSVNDPQVLARIKQARRDGVSLVVYSGYGGQLVSRDILDCGIPFLHAHSGWLPDYSGSTTLYYSILNGDGCGVSAILLTPNIDEGPVVARERYPLPPAAVNIDYFYDPAIRADLMVKALSEWSVNKDFANCVSQGDGLRHAFYVVHPVLKYLALQKLKSQSKTAASR